MASEEEGGDRLGLPPPALPPAGAAAACPSTAPALPPSSLQFVYAKLVGTFPFNAFLAGFFCCVGTFVLTLALRMKVGEGGSSHDFGGYALAMLTLFVASWNYVG